MSDSKFHVGQTVVVIKPQIGRGGFQGMRGTVKEIDVMSQPFVKVLLDFSASSSEDQWFTEEELTAPVFDSRFKIGQRVEVSNASEQSRQHAGSTGEVVSLDRDELPVLVRFDKLSDDETQWWFADEELTMVDSVETLEQKRDRLKAELAAAEAELHDALRPQASEMTVGTIVRLWDRANSTPVLHIKQGPNNWTRVGVSKAREDNMPTTYSHSDFDTQPFINAEWDSKGRVDIRSGK